MAVNLSPVGGVAAQFFTNNGTPLTGGKLYTYSAGSTTPAATFTSFNGSTAWTNPIVLDAAGRVPGSGEIWLTDGVIYKFILKDSNDVLIATYDNITGINSNSVAFVNQQEIVTATAGQTVFNLGINYQPATNSLSVFVDGVNQYGPGALYAYVETDSNTVTFTSGLHVGAEVKFTTTQQQSAGAVDAAQVTYEPPFTGFVATNVEAKLAQTVSVKDFGAVGDGVADDTAAFNAAIAAAARTWGVGGETTGADVFVPGGRYVLGSSISISNNAGVCLIGEGKTKSNLIAGNASMVVIDLVNNNNARMFLRGLRIHGGSASSGVAIRTSTAGNQIDVRDCWIDTFAKGIVGNPNSDSYVTDCTMEYVAKVLELTSSNDITVTNNTFVDCGPISLGPGSFDPMFDISGSERIGILNNRIIATSGMSYQPNGNVRFSSCTDCMFSGNIMNRVISYDGPFIKSQNSSGLIISNNLFGKSTEQTILDIDSNNVTIDGNTFSGTTAVGNMTIELRGTAGWSVENNKFRNNGGLYDFQGINGTGLIRDGVLDGNKFALGYNITTLGGNMYVGKANVGGTNRAWLGGAPTTGSWIRNDVVWIPATAGSFAGFVCTASGTPGTWKTFAAISP